MILDNFHFLINDMTFLHFYSQQKDVSSMNSYLNIFIERLDTDKSYKCSMIVIGNFLASTTLES